MGNSCNLDYLSIQELLGALNQLGLYGRLDSCQSLGRRMMETVRHGLGLCQKCWLSDHLGPSYGPPTEESSAKIRIHEGVSECEGLGLFTVPDNVTVTREIDY